MNKAWPLRDKPAHFDDITLPLRHALCQLYRLERLELVDIEWTGLDTGELTRAGCPSPDALLTKAAIQHNEKKDRYALDIILLIALQLGIEQGRRLTLQDLCLTKEIDRIRTTLNHLDPRID